MQIVPYAKPFAPRILRHMPSLSLLGRPVSIRSSWLKPENVFTVKCFYAWCGGYLFSALCKDFRFHTSLTWCFWHTQYGWFRCRWCLSFSSNAYLVQILWHRHSQNVIHDAQARSIFALAFYRADVVKFEIRNPIFVMSGRFHAHSSLWKTFRQACWRQAGSQLQPILVQPGL